MNWYLYLMTNWTVIGFTIVAVSILLIIGGMCFCAVEPKSETVIQKRVGIACMIAGVSLFLLLALFPNKLYWTTVTQPICQQHSAETQGE